MRKLILAVAILQFVITFTDQYKFGDIISFKRKCLHSAVNYKHFAVYVGGGPKIHDEQVGHDIFQRTGPVLRLFPPQLSDCIFDDLKNEQKNSNNLEVKVDNYLDGVAGFTVGTQAEMAARIKEKLHKCGVYRPVCNNCEHVATYVRYNEKLSLQDGALASNLCGADKKKCEELQRIAKEIQESMKAEYECNNNKPGDKNG